MSLCVWMPMRVLSFSHATLVTRVISSGKQPPFVSHNTTASAPPIAAGHAERGNFGVLKLAPLRLLDKLHLLGIRAGPAPFNQINPEKVELLGDANFIRRREIDAFALRAIAQSRVIKFHVRI